MVAPIDDKVSGYPAVVFPCGAFWHDGEIVVTYGYHDHRARAAIYHPTALALRLVEVTPGP